MPISEPSWLKIESLATDVNIFPPKVQVLVDFCVCIALGTVTIV